MRLFHQARQVAVSRHFPAFLLWKTFASQRAASRSLIKVTKAFAIGLLFLIAIRNVVEALA